MTKTEHVAAKDYQRLMAKGRGKQPETLIRQTVKAWLEWRGWDVTVHHQNALSRKGFPDLTALKDGVTLYLEIKTATGRLSEHQQHFRAAVTAFGGRYLVVRGVDDLIREGL